MIPFIARLALAAAIALAAAPGQAKQVCVEELSGVCLKFKEVPDAPTKKAAPKKPARQVSPAERAERQLGLTRTDRRGVQAALRNLGYYSGGIDGVLGRGSRGAIRSWQRDQGFGATGYLAQGQVRDLAQQAAASAEPAPQPAAPEPAPKVATPAPAAPKVETVVKAPEPERDPIVGRTYTHRYSNSAWEFNVKLDVTSSSTGQMRIFINTAQASSPADTVCDVPLSGPFECRLVYYVTQAGSTDAFFRGTLPNVSVSAQNLYESFARSFTLW